MKKDMLGFAAGLSEEAGKLLLSKFRSVKDIRQKEQRHDFVTEADLESDRLIISRIMENHPGHAISSEESGEMDGSGYKWMIDPLDGTNNYAYGVPIFGVSVGLLKKGRPFAGAISIPLLGEVFCAQAGKGAFLNGKRIRVSKRKFGDAMVMYDSEVTNPSKRPEILKSLAAMSGEVAKIRISGSAVFDLMRVARGDADLWVEHEIKCWDIAAACLIVEEAGGRATGFGGKRWAPETKALLVSNGVCHKDALGLMKDIGLGGKG